MRYLLRTNTSFEHLAKKFERTVLTCVGRDGSEIAVCLRRFFVRSHFLASESGLYKLPSTFCHVPPDSSNHEVVVVRRVARNSQWGGCLGGLGAEPPANGAAGGQWGSGGEAPSARKFCIFLQK